MVTEHGVSAGDRQVKLCSGENHQGCDFAGESEVEVGSVPANSSGLVPGLLGRRLGPALHCCPPVWDQGLCSQHHWWRWVGMISMGCVAGLAHWRVPLGSQALLACRCPLAA